MKLSFVIVEYFSIEELDACIMSIEQSIDRYAYEIIISSNSRYSINEQQRIARYYSQYKWCFNSLNGGFAYAMNRGLEQTTGDIVIILNPDTQICYGLGDMIDYLFMHPNVGVVAPKIVNSNKIVQDSYREFITPFNFSSRHIKRLLGICSKTKNDICEPIIVDWVIGAFMMMPKEVYNIVGGLDENYFLYCEDMDLCRTIKKKGYDVVYFPKMEIVYEGTRSARHSLKYTFVFCKSLLRYWSKCII